MKSGDGNVQYSSLALDENTQEKAAMSPPIDEQERSAMLGMGKVIEELRVAEKEGTCAIESDSIYGAAMAIPQIARSCRWPMTMIVLMIRMYMFLIINYLAQAIAIYYIYDGQTNMSPFAGQMHLCDFAMGISNCPGGKNCIGPGGTDYDNPGRLYSYDIWSTRMFLKDSLAMVLPGQAASVESNLDPGEYGVESGFCRLICTFVFIVQVADEFEKILSLAWMLWALPDNGKAWVTYQVPTWGTKEYVKKVHGHEELDLVSFQVQGMPVMWKVINVLIILIPRTLLWKNLAFAGVYFLMETASMVDEIVNTTALAFVLGIDELILERLTTPMARHIMANISPLKFYDENHLDSDPDETVISNFINSEIGCGNIRRKLGNIIPRRLLWTLTFTAFFLWEYYTTNCVTTEDGSWVSRDMYLPPDAHLNPLCLFIHCREHDKGTEAFWTMPSNHEEA